MVSHPPLSVATTLLAPHPPCCSRATAMVERERERERERDSEREREREKKIDRERQRERERAWERAHELSSCLV